MQTLLAISLVLAAASLLLTCATHVAVRLRLRRAPRVPAQFPAISVLKPLKGVDDDLYENLVSLASQDYPSFELLVGCEDPLDPALVLARRLQRQFPDVTIRILAGADARGCNPKVNNLRMLARAAAHDWLLVSDSSVRARPDYLHAMAAELVPGVGLVSSVLVGAGERNLGARLDNLQMNSFVVRGVCGADVLASHSCVVGKSMLFRRSELLRLGGFELVENVLAEDYVLGQRFREAGLAVVLSSHLLPSVSTHRTVGEFCSRQVRWSQMRRHLAPMLYLAEPIQSPLPWLLLAFACLSCGASPGCSGWLLLCLSGGFAFRLASDANLIRALRGSPLAPSDYLSIVVKDLLYVGIWAYGGLKRQVSWRGTSMRIGPGSTLIPLEDGSRDRQALEGA